MGKNEIKHEKTPQIWGGKILPRNEFDIWWSRNLGYLRFEKKTAELSLVEVGGWTLNHPKHLKISQSSVARESLSPLGGLFVWLVFSDPKNMSQQGNYCYCFVQLSQMFQGEQNSKTITHNQVKALPLPTSSDDAEQINLVC